MITDFTTVTTHCSCQKIRAVFRVLGIYNFGYLINYVFSPLQRWQTDSTIPANIDVMVNRFFLNGKGMSTVIYF